MPNHQAVTDENADAKTLRIGGAWDYCHWVDKGLDISNEYLKKNNIKSQSTKPINGKYDIIFQGQEIRLLRDWFCSGSRLLDKDEAERLGISRPTLPIEESRGLFIFSRECPALEFDRLYQYEEDHNKKHKSP